jgi:hypothetical protein
MPENGLKMTLETHLRGSQAFQQVIGRHFGSFLDA